MHWVGGADWRKEEGQHRMSGASFGEVNGQKGKYIKLEDVDWIEEIW